ncbi:MAG: Na/Pi cotransporter family protein [Chitinophagales bacterium]
MKELIFGLIGGTALLMYGVDMMGEGLERVSGPMMKKVLAALTGKLWKAFLAGTILTALVQSSTAITVLSVGFVNAGLMTLRQAVGIIYGANIGTTITAQLMAFSFKLTDIALVVLGLGFAIQFFARTRWQKDLGQAIMGFGIMFLGLKILNSGVPIIRNSPTTRYFFEHYANQPLFAIVIGMVATMLVHSSSATVGLTMVLATAGLINLNGAIGLMLGDNIGTCITAQLASLGANTSARRTAWAHTLYNIIGVLLAMLVFGLFRKMIAGTSPNIAQQVANSHTIFNVLSAVIFLPFTNQYVKFLEWIVPDREKAPAAKFTYIDPRFLDTPVVAISATVKEIAACAELTRRMVRDSLEGLVHDDLDRLEKVFRDEERVNELQQAITEYLIALSNQDVGADVSAKIPTLVHCINDIERIGDHAENLAELAKDKVEKGLPFSDAAIRELENLLAEIDSMTVETLRALEEGDPEAAGVVLEHEKRFDALTDSLREHHIRRLEEGRCRVQSGVIFLDIVSNLERAADHLENVAEAVAKDFRWEHREPA